MSARRSTLQCGLRWHSSGPGCRPARTALTDHAPSLRLQGLAGPGAVVLFLAGTFSAIDWGMSLEPRWPSTIYGALVIVGDALATMAFMIAVSSLLARTRPMAEIATPGRLNDLGNLLLAFVMLWAYMSFCQFLIIWSGNLAEEIPWYLRRTRGGWQWVALTLVVFQFFLPFFYLLFRENKRRPSPLLRVAFSVLALRWVELVWLVIPASSDPARPQIRWIEIPIAVVATAGIGGLWLAVLIGRLEALAACTTQRPLSERGTRARRRLIRVDDFLPQATRTAESTHGHAANSVSVGGLVVFASSLVILGIVVELILGGVIKGLYRESKSVHELAAPRLQDGSAEYPAPRLQANPAGEFTSFKEQELARLNGYGWVDEKKGIAHIPIDRAIEILAVKGLPKGSGSRAALTPAEAAAPAPRPAALPNQPEAPARDPARPAPNQPESPARESARPSSPGDPQQ